MVERERAHRAQPATFAGPPTDVELSWDDRAEFLQAVAGVGSTEDSARTLLQAIGYPIQHLPAWSRPTDWWSQIFTDFDNGIAIEPYRRLIIALARRYQGNRVFLRLQTQYATPAPETEEAAPATCHVIVRASDEAERAEAQSTLREIHLEPREVWSTEHAVSYAVNSTDAAQVRQALANTSLGWTVVPPGRPDYLYRELIVQGPDGSRFMLVDAPAQQTFRNVAGEVVAQYGPDFADASRPTVVDHVRGDEAERVNPDDTLHEAGVQDGDQLRVAFEANAGVNPIDHENALVRALNETKSFAARRPDVEVRADSQTMPSEIEIDFSQESFGPPAVLGGEPVRVSWHTVLMEFGPDYPDTAPDAFWRTPFFHPNVFPNYDCEQLRREPQLKGWVCLGVLKESWYPKRDFGDVCRMLVDMAGYRNYEIFDLRDPGRQEPRANFVDQAAAQWVITHEAEILEIGGRPILPPADVEPKGQRNVIYPAG